MTLTASQPKAFIDKCTYYIAKHNCVYISKNTPIGAIRVTRAEHHCYDKTKGANRVTELKGKKRDELRSRETKEGEKKASAQIQIYRISSDTRNGSLFLTRLHMCQLDIRCRGKNEIYICYALAERWIFFRREIGKFFFKCNVICLSVFKLEAAYFSLLILKFLGCDFANIYIIDCFHSSQLSEIVIWKL